MLQCCSRLSLLHLSSCFDDNRKLYLACDGLTQLWGDDHCLLTIQFLSFFCQHHCCQHTITGGSVLAFLAHVHLHFFVSFCAQFEETTYNHILFIFFCVVSLPIPLNFRPKLDLQPKLWLFSSSKQLSFTEYSDLTHLQLGLHSGVASIDCRIVVFLPLFAKNRGLWV